MLIVLFFILIGERKKQKTPMTKELLCQGRTNGPRCHLDSRFYFRALAGYNDIPGI